jgi:hypothetical protein
VVARTAANNSEVKTVSTTRQFELLYEAVSKQTTVPVDVVREIAERMMQSQTGIVYGNFASNLRRRCIIRRDCVDVVGTDKSETR